METLQERINAYMHGWTNKRLDDYAFVLLLPDENNELNSRIRDAFEQKLKGRSGVVVEGELARELVHLYELYEFSGKIIVGSFDKPFGRKLNNLLDCGITNMQTLIHDVILGAL
jgi:hypothetical protein